MGWLSVLLSGAAACLLFASGHTVLMVVAIVAAIGCFWSWGVMHAQLLYYPWFKLPILVLLSTA